MAAAPKRRTVRTKANKQTTPKRAAPSSQPSKLDQVVNALRTPKGATLADLMKLTGWQMHSARGAIAGALKKKRGLKVISEKVGEERVYRIGGKA